MKRVTGRCGARNRSIRVLAAAVGATAMAWHGPAGAALIFDLRALPGAGYSVSNDLGAGKHVTATSYGNVVSMQLFARVSGTDGLNNELLQSAGCSLASSIGGLLGNITHTIGNPTFAGSSSSNGTVQDFDSDGDLDVGSVGTGAAGKVVYRANAPTPLTSSNSTFIDADTAEVLLGTVSFTLSTGAGSSMVQVIPRGGTTSGVAQWNQDGVATAKTPGTGTFGANSPGVLIELAPLDLYWDVNGSNTGAGGPTPTGTWGAGTNWSTDAGGVIASQAWTSVAAARFAAGTDASGSYTVTVSGTQTVSRLHFEEGAVTLSGGQIALVTGGIEVTSAGVATVNSILSGVTSLTKTGTGTVTLGGVNTYSGGTIINAGTLRVGSDANLGAASSVTISGGTLEASASFNTSRGIVVSGTGGTIEVAPGALLVLNNGVSGSAGLTKTGSGDLALTTTGQTYIGDTTVNGGTLRTATHNALPSGSGKGNVLVNNGGTLDLNGFSSSVNALSNAPGQTGGIVFTQGASSQLTIGVNNASSTFDGTIQNGLGTVALAKTGTGTFTLTGTNTYTGGTIVNGGVLQVGNGGTSGSVVGSISLGNTQLIFNRSNSSTFAGIISGSGSMTKIGAGTLVLTGNSTFTGSTTVNAGTFSVANTSGVALPGNVTVNNAGSTLASGNNSTSSIGGSVTLNSATIAQPGGPGSPGTLTVGSLVANSATFNFDLSSVGQDLLAMPGVLSLSGVNTINVAGSGFIPGSYTLLSYASKTGPTFTLGSTPVIPGFSYDLVTGATSTVIQVTGGQIWTGAAGTDWDVSLTPNWTGLTTTFANDDFVTFDDSATGTTNVTIDAGGVAPSTVLFNNSAKNYTVDGGSIVNQSGGPTRLVKTGTGTVTLNNTNTFTGGVELFGGVLEIASAGAIGSVSGVSIANNAALRAASSLSTDRVITIGTGGAALDSGASTFTVTSAIGGSGAMTKVGSGTLRLDAVNTYSGDTIVSAGTLRAGVANAIPSGAGKGNLVVNNSATFDLAGVAVGVNGLGNGVGQTTGVVTNSASGMAQLTVGINDTTTTFAGSIQNGAGSIALVKTGGGTFKLAGVNTYTGGMTISAGTLAIGSSGALPVGGSVVVAGGSLDVNTNSPAAGAVTLLSGSIVGTTGVLTASGYAFQSGSVSARLAGTSGLTKTTTGLVTLTGSNSYTGATTIQDGVLSAGTIAAGGSNCAIGASSASPANLVLNGGTLSYLPASAAPATTDRLFTVGVAGGTLDATGASSASTLSFTNAGSVALDGAGDRTLVLRSNNFGNSTFSPSLGDPSAGKTSLAKDGAGTWVLSGAGKTYSGGTVVVAGTLKIGSADVLPFGAGKGDLSIGSGATVEMNSNHLKVNGLIGAGTINNISGNRTLNIGLGGGNASFSGAISGSINLSKTAGGAGTQVLSGPLSYTGATAVSGGRLVLATDLNSSAPVTVADGCVLELAAGSGAVLKTPTLILSSTGKVDIGGNRIVTADPVGTWNGSAYSGVSGLIATGRGDGSWNGNGIVTSRPEAVTSEYANVGVARASEVMGIGINQTAAWSGTTVLGSDTLVMYTYGGDADLSGAVDVDDYGQIDFNVALGGLVHGYFNGDFNLDGSINADDYGIIDFTFGIQGPPFATASAAGLTVQSVPEPAGILSPVTAMLLGRVARRQRRRPPPFD